MPPNKPNPPNPTPPEIETETPEWLREIWGGSPDFPDRIPDLPPEDVEIL